MKKTYISPVIELADMELQEMLAGSALTKDSSGDLTGGELQDQDATGEGLSRYFDVWDDDLEN